MDPLSDFLSRLKLQSYKFGGLDAGGAWAIRFGDYRGLKVYAVVSGTCWLAVDGGKGPTRLHAGDAFLLSKGRPFRLASDASGVENGPFLVPDPVDSGQIGAINGGGGVFIEGGHFTLASRDANLLLDALPPVVQLQDEADRTTLRWCIGQMRQELPGAKPGSFLIAQQLCTVMLVQALRLHLERGAPGGVGWLFALSDARLAAAIGAMHGDPSRRWTLQELARCAGMSRTSFALRFKAAVGASPIEHLSGWRMLLAKDRLAHTTDRVSAIALASGYESESAFSSAFRRVSGFAPRRYRLDHASRPGVQPADS